jgi:Asp-tRNA(Asn)/Glu-tRNA(Gln) amidotransferase A subunit family amidase
MSDNKILQATCPMIVEESGWGHGRLIRNRVFTNKLTENLALVTARDELIGALEAFFSRGDALLCPVGGSPALLHCPQETPIEVDEQTISYWRAGIAYADPFNLTGHPSVVVPAEYPSEGLPIGVRIVGPHWSDMGALALARRVEAVIGPFRWPPGH